MTVTTSICAIIPTFNRSQYLKECIGSLLSQTRAPDQIIVVNDGSTDDTEDVVRSYGDQVTLLNKPNGGKSSALNLALQHCHSDYVWICDDDDIAAPDGLQHLANAIDADPQLDMVFGRYERFTMEGNGVVFSDPDYWARASEPNYKICFMEGMFAPQFTTLVRRDLYTAVGPFNEKFIRSQDYEMALRLTRTAKMKYVPETIYFYRDHHAARGTGQFNFPQAESYRKWHEFEKKALAPVYQTYSLDEFTPSFAFLLTPSAKKRAQYLQRGIIMASHGLWTEAASDIESAAEADPSPLSQKETELLDGYLRVDFSFKDLLNSPPAIERIRNTAQSSATGEAIVKTLFRHMVWKVKKSFISGNTNESLLYTKILLKIFGVYGTTEKVFKALLR